MSDDKDKGDSPDYEKMSWGEIGKLTLGRIVVAGVVIWATAKLVMIAIANSVPKK